VLAISRVGQHATFAFFPNGMVYAESMIVFPLDTHAAFCTLKSRAHEVWACFFGSSMKDDFRADLMVRNDEGLTKTYNRFHDRNENAPEIVQLRDLHAAMDRAVLDSYGWTDVPTDCEFRKKKPYRCRWPDNVRDEVLARLLELNGQRAAEEADACKAGRGKATRSPPRKRR